MRCMRRTRARWPRSPDRARTRDGPAPIQIPSTRSSFHDLGSRAARTRAANPRWSTSRSRARPPATSGPGRADARAAPGSARAPPASLGGAGTRLRWSHTVPPSRLRRPRSSEPLGRSGRAHASDDRAVAPDERGAVHECSVTSESLALHGVMSCGRRGKGARHASPSEFRSLRGKLARSASQ